jgi:hypothetical protein
VKTFDQAEFGFKLSNCWTVLAKDCSIERTYAVLAKKINGGETEEKAVKILTPFGKVKLTKKPQSESIVLEKDGVVTPLRRSQPLEITQKDTVIMSIVREHGDYVKVYLPGQGVKVYFDGFNVNIKMQTPIYMGRQCGICGNMDADPETEFYRLDSDNNEFAEPEMNIRKAFHQYTIKDDKCSRPENYEDMCTDENCRYERTEYPEEYRRMRDPYDLPSQFDYRSTVKPVRKTRKIERHGKICFSTKPIPTCPSHTYPTGVKKTEEVIFKCPSKYSSFWGNQDSSSSSSSSSSAESADSSKLKSGSGSDESSSDSSTDSQQQQQTSTRGGQKVKAISASASSSSSQSDSQSTSSSERFYDSASNEQQENGETTTVTMTVNIPEGCRKL